MAKPDAPQTLTGWGAKHEERLQVLREGGKTPDDDIEWDILFRLFHAPDRQVRAAEELPNCQRLQIVKQRTADYLRSFWIAWDRIASYPKEQ